MQMLLRLIESPILDDETMKLVAFGMSHSAMLTCFS